MIGALGVLLLATGSLVAALGLYLVMLAVAAFVGGRDQPARRVGVTPATTLAVIVPAHDEEQLIGRCIESLRRQDYPAGRYRIVVIADNCSDRTAEKASEAGAMVMVRASAPEARGKGQALRWAMDRLLAEPEPPEAVVVVDADSVCEPGMLSALEDKLAEGHAVVQADYSLFVDSGSPRSDLLAVAFLLFAIALRLMDDGGRRAS